MLGLACLSLAKHVAKWIKRLQEANISYNANQVMHEISDIPVQDDEQMVSLDVEVLFTNVVVQESIEYTSELVYSRGQDIQPPVDKDAY